VGCPQNELAILEFIHCIVETLDRFFANVCELDIMFHIDKVRARASLTRIARRGGRETLRETSRGFSPWPTRSRTCTLRRLWC
jgi:hypothetical protein